jgi:mycofactocin precursor
MSVAEPVDTIVEVEVEVEAPAAAAYPDDDLDDIEETLVEEISIDGMCGVY